MKKNPLWLILLLAFAAVNIYAFIAGTFGELVVFLQDLGPWGTLAIADLLVALTIGVGWMWQDARTRAINPVPYLLLTLATGSLGLLAYLVRNGIAGKAGGVPSGRRNAGSAEPVVG